MPQNHIFWSSKSVTTVASDWIEVGGLGSQPTIGNTVKMK
jgi:hypothetical protein